MGIQLREALQRLCVEIGWSYAVFWRAILNRNQMHLVWEDGHYEPKFGTPGISGFEAMDMLLKKRVALQNSRDDLFPEPGCQIEDRVRTLVYKTMAPQVHIVGDGIVGLSALTGNHQWIVQDFLSDYGSVPKVGGYAVGYQKLVFVTVRGSGHFVPSYQPARALTLFSSFLNGKLPPRA